MLPALDEQPLLEPQGSCPTQLEVGPLEVRRAAHRCAGRAARSGPRRRRPAPRLADSPPVRRRRRRAAAGRRRAGCCSPPPLLSSRAARRSVRSRTCSRRGPPAFMRSTMAVTRSTSVPTAVMRPPGSLNNASQALGQSASIQRHVHDPPRGPWTSSRSGWRAFASPGRRRRTRLALSSPGPLFTTAAYRNIRTVSKPMGNAVRAGIGTDSKPLLSETRPAGRPPLVA